MKQLPLMEAYLTVQGEGFHQGTPSWFIRLGGCDVGCTWCDTKDSWDASDFPKTDVSVIADEAAASGARMVVVTGGEPLMYDLTALTDALMAAGLETHIETSGAYELTGQWDWICFSPKKFKEPLPEFYQKANEIKVIVYHPSDLDWAREQTIETPENIVRSLQPEWSKREEMTPLIFEFIKDNPAWNVSMQLHKLMGVR